MTPPLERHGSPSTRRRKLIRWAIRLLILYTALGFLILPPIIRVIARKQLTSELNREVSIKSVRLNPYTLSCSVRGLLIKDPDGEPLISWDKVYVNFQLSSFFGKPWVFKEVSATNIYVRAQMNKDYTFNFSDLIEKFSKSEPSKEPSKPLALRIAKLNVSGVRASIADLTPRDPFRRVIGPLQISLRNFHTDPDSRNPHSFTGSTDSGEVFSWRGNFSLDPVRAEGELSVENITLNKYSPLYQDLVRFEIRDGVASFRGGYQFVASPTNHAFSITNVGAALRSFVLARPGTSNILVEMPSFAVSGINGDLILRNVDVDSLSVSGAVINLRRSRDGVINVVEMATPPESSTNVPSTVLLLMRGVTNLFSILLASTNQGTVGLRELSVSNCAVSLDDNINSRPVNLLMHEINVSAKNLSNRPGTSMVLNASLRWNTNGTAHAEVTASTSPLAAEATFGCDRLELQPLDPYLESLVNVFVLGSKMSLDGRIRLRLEPGEELPTVTFNGGYRLEDFATVDGRTGEDLAKWRELSVEGIDAKLNPPTIAVQKVGLNDAFVRFGIESNGVLNLAGAMHPRRTNQEPQIASPSPQGKREPSPRWVLSAVKDVMTHTNTPSTIMGIRLSIATVAISNAEVQLSDLSLSPNVHASVQQINGTITDISSEELRRAGIQFEGRVGGAGPVEITGQLNPLHYDNASKVTVVMKDVDMNPGDPYAQKFLGYRLRKGKVSMDVGYEVTARHLKGVNLVRLDQFTLGDKVESPDAVKLPVKLGVALLKDRSGKIELNVPVEGNLDDPEFRLSKVIWHAVGNVFNKIVASPFTALGGLFGGKGEEVGYQNFKPGESELVASEKEKLDDIAKGMYERPGLEVEIEGSYDPVADRDGLRRVKLDQQLRLHKWSNLRKSEQAATSPQEIVLTPEERTRLIAGLYQGSTNVPVAESGSKPAPKPTKVTAVAGASEKGAQVLMGPQLTAEERANVASETERSLLQTISISENDLRDLARARAVQVQNYLVQTAKVEAERVYLTQDRQGSAGTNGHKVFLHLQ